MRTAKLYRLPSGAAGPGDRHRPRPTARRLPPALGLEALDLLGIDIDQDPRAFAQFLELQNRAQVGRG